MRATSAGLLVLITAITIAGCGMTYQASPYEEQLWRMAQEYGYGRVFHTHVPGYGMCAAVLVYGTGGNRFSAETNAYRKGQKFFNPSIGNIPVIGEMIIDKREVITLESRKSRKSDGSWLVESIIISPLR